MKLFSPNLVLVQQIPIKKPNSELFLSPSYISCLKSDNNSKFIFMLTGKKLLSSLEIKFIENENQTENYIDNTEKLPYIKYKLYNHQTKGMRSKSYSASLMINENSSFIGGYDGSLSLLDKREKELNIINMIHLDAIHHFQNLKSSNQLNKQGIYIIFLK